MSVILLTQGKSAIVDDEDYEMLMKYKWHYSEYGDGKGYAKTNNRNKKGEPALLRMHRLVMKAKSTQKVDHINMNTLDNRKSNLRFVTQSQNMINARIRKNNTSGYKGVCFLKREQKWRANTWKDGKQIWIGDYNNIKDAAHAYNAVVSKLHGEYALLNKV